MRELGVYPITHAIPFAIKMKHVSKLLGLSLAVVALLLSACAKKPVRPDPTTTAMGPGTNNMVNPDSIALPGENINLEQRPEGTLDQAGKSVVEPIYFAFCSFGRSSGASEAAERAQMAAG